MYLPAYNLLRVFFAFTIIFNRLQKKNNNKSSNEDALICKSVLIC